MSSLGYQIPRFQEDYVAPLRAQGATEEYIEVWFNMMDGKTPDPGVLAVAVSQIDIKFGVEPRPSGYKPSGYKWHRSLLSVALLRRNLEGVRTLLEAGADPNVAGAQFAKTARPTTYPELGGGPDWSTSVQFLELYVAQSGWVDYPTPSDPFPMINRAASNGNFEGVKYLLSQGADPRIEVRGLNPSRPPLGDNRYGFPRMLGGTVETMAFVQWFFDNGYMTDAPEKMVALINDNHRRDHSGPDDDGYGRNRNAALYPSDQLGPAGWLQAGRARGRCARPERLCRASR